MRSQHLSWMLVAVGCASAVEVREPPRTVTISTQPVARDEPVPAASLPASPVPMAESSDAVQSESVEGGADTFVGATSGPPPPPPPAGAASTSRPVAVPDQVTPPEALSRVVPEYPPAARSQGIEAVVIVKFVVTASGTVEQVRILRGHPLFDTAVVDAVSRWTFRPARAKNQPIAVERVVRFPFRLAP